MGRHRRFYQSWFVSSFGFSYLRHDPRFNLSFIFVPLDSHHWDTILLSFSIYSLFISFLFIWTPSLVISKLNRLFLWFLITWTTFCYLKLFLFHLVSHHWKVILGSLFKFNHLFLWILIIGTPSYVHSHFILFFILFLIIERSL